MWVKRIFFLFKMSSWIKEILDSYALHKKKKEFRKYKEGMMVYPGIHCSLTMWQMKICWEWQVLNKDLQKEKKIWNGNRNKIVHCLFLPKKKKRKGFWFISLQFVNPLMKILIKISISRFFNSTNDKSTQ